MSSTKTAAVLVPAIPVPPVDIASNLPQLASIQLALTKEIIEIRPGFKLVRAAWSSISVWPEAVSKTYRFGPPAAMADSTKGFPSFLDLCCRIGINSSVGSQVMSQ